MLKLRRNFLQIPQLLALGAVVRLEVAVAQEEVILKDSDPEAIAIQYQSDATQVDHQRYPKYAVGQACSNCNVFYADAGATSGTCGIVFGKVVAAKGWCSSYEKKAS